MYRLSWVLLFPGPFDISHANNDVGLNIEEFTTTFQLCSNFDRFTYTRTHPHTHTHTHSLSHTHTHSLSHTHTHTHAHKQTHTNTPPCCPSHLFIIPSSLNPTLSIPLSL